MAMKKIILLQIGFFLIAVAGAFGGMSAIINLSYTPLAMILGVYLFRTASPSYLSFCMWLWMLTPLVRRLVDYHTSYHAQSVVMLAPFIVSCISAMSVRKVLSRRLPSHVLPYLGIMAIVFWGYVVGIFQSGIFAASYAALTWLSPLFLAIHILTHADAVEEHAQHVFKAFSISTLLMGLYGLYQFFLYPEWDKYWVDSVSIIGIGIAEAGSVRIFSTMNAPAVLALYLTAGILVTIQKRGKMTAIICSIGITGLMLSLVRSAWVSFLVAFALMLLAMPFGKRVRYIIAATAVIIASLPLLLMGPISERVQQRLQTFSSVNDDVSFQARSDLYRNFTERATDSMIGNGLGQTGTASRLSGESALASLDSGVLDLLYTFGFFSLIIFFCTFVIAYYSLKKLRLGGAAQTAGAVTVALVFQLMFSNILYAPTGVLFFVFSSIAIAHRSSTSLSSPI